MDSLVIHILTGLAVYPIAFAYWYLYWYIQPIDPNSLKFAHDVVSGEPLSNKARRKANRIKFAANAGAFMLGCIWLILGNYFAKSSSLSSDILALFKFSSLNLHSYLYVWMCCMVALIFLARYSAKLLVGGKKWGDDPRRLY